MSVEYNYNFADVEQKDNQEEVKTFSVIANKDEVLQMYLKDISKIKLLKKTVKIKNF